MVENAPVPALLCPGSLNRVLEAAIAASQEGAHDPLAWNLTFALKVRDATKSYHIKGDVCVFVCLFIWKEKDKRAAGPLEFSLAGNLLTGSDKIFIPN